VATISVSVLKIVFTHRFFSELQVIHILRFEVAAMLILRIQVFWLSYTAFIFKG